MTKFAILDNLFVIEHGTALDLNKMEKCNTQDSAIAFIGRSSERNGQVALVKRVEKIKPLNAGLITVALGGSSLSSFVQPQPFYTGQNIDTLIPKQTMSLNEKLYYCLCIEANSFRYSTFGREANRTLKKLRVPASAPSWVSGASTRALHTLQQDLSKAAQA